MSPWRATSSSAPRATSSSAEADWASYLLFDGGFARELIEVGRRDAHDKAEEIRAFFAETGVISRGRWNWAVPKRVLLVDDDGVTRSVLAKLLGARGYDVIEAESGGTALRVSSQPDAPRMAVVDWNMGTINGPELCRILRGRAPYIYVVLTTAREGRKPLVEAMNSGADGYIQKPLDADEIEAWLVAGQRIVDLQDRLLKVQAELERRATHDALTGMRNRGSLLEILGREIAARGAPNRPPASCSSTSIIQVHQRHARASGRRRGLGRGRQALRGNGARLRRVRSPRR